MSAVQPARRWRGFRQLSIRNKLLVLVLLPLLVVLPLLGLILLWWTNIAFDRLLVTKVRSDLAVAQGYFDHTLGQVGASAAAVADSHELHLALQAPPGEAVVALLRRFQQREQLDFINLRAPDGRVLATGERLVAPSDAAAPPRAMPPSVTDRLGIEVLDASQLELLPEALRARVAVPLLATRNAAPTARRSEDRAMLLAATHAVRDTEGRLLGHLQGGVLLNRNLGFIDHVNEIVYPEGALPFGSQGTTTLFLDDVRIGTNVRLFGGVEDERAIGTRVSAEVRGAVLGQGRTWLDRAFVVNDWYVSAYQPLRDVDGQRIGMLYVGFLERPFTVVKVAMLGGIGIVFFAVMIAAAVVSLRWARAIFAPIERMEATMRRVEGGALDARVGEVGSDDEIGRLARRLDDLLATLQRWNAELDAKVAQRTEQLEQTQAQLVRSEKLATIGQLTASIAHEVNNPIAVIQGNLDVLRSQLPAAAAQGVKAELALIDQQVERMRLIVTQLLQFARPTEYAGYVEDVDVARALEDCLVLVSHLLATARIEVRREIGAVPAVPVNRQELQQVLVNLMVNAIQAMPGGGTLTLAARSAPTHDGMRVEIAVADSGPGLAPELLEQLFQPFVTRKRDGTGLGLWISRGIVERYGGDIAAANRAEGGAVFTVSLPLEPR